MARYEVNNLITELADLLTTDDQAKKAMKDALANGSGAYDMGPILRKFFNNDEKHKKAAEQAIKDCQEIPSVYESLVGVALEQIIDPPTPAENIAYALFYALKEGYLKATTEEQKGQFVQMLKSLKQTGFSNTDMERNTFLGAIDLKAPTEELKDESPVAELLFLAGANNWTYPPLEFSGLHLVLLQNKLFNTGQVIRATGVKVRQEVASYHERIFQAILADDDALNAVNTATAQGKLTMYPLEIACSRQNPAAVKALIKHGADPGQCPGLAGYIKKGAEANNMVHGPKLSMEQINQWRREYLARQELLNSGPSAEDDIHSSPATMPSAPRSPAGLQKPMLTAVLGIAVKAFLLALAETIAIAILNNLKNPFVHKNFIILMPIAVSLLMISLSLVVTILSTVSMVSKKVAAEASNVDPVNTGDVWAVPYEATATEPKTLIATEHETAYKPLAHETERDSEVVSDDLSLAAKTAGHGVLKRARSMSSFDQNAEVSDATLKAKRAKVDDVPVVADAATAGHGVLKRARSMSSFDPNANSQKVDDVLQGADAAGHGVLSKSHDMAKH